ncbi:hypothetical protein [Halovivax sp.]|uniref:hypothetical protein n=1 Tax=Halovivax sp. TaxID=1935978 RepID=UPI0025C4E81D|nr:hypothetical protein [Halovivax sp.]
MVPDERQLRTHLVPDEPLHDVASGRVVDDSAGGRVAIALTDRRVLCLSDDGELVDVDYGSICSIRSWSRSRLTFEGIDSRLVSLGGAVLAVLAFTLGLLYAAQARPNGGLIGISLALAAVMGAAGFEYVRRRRHRGPVDRELVAGGVLAGAIALLAFVATIAYVSRVVVPALLVATLATAALSDRAARNENAHDGLEFDRVHEKELTIHTIDGDEVRIVVDGRSDVDHRLSRLASVEKRQATDATTTGSVAE